MNKLEKALNITFDNSELLLEAMTHRSYKFENHEEMPDNQRLEFLGDAVLELITSRYLYERYQEAPEGDLTKYRAALVQESALFDCAKTISLGQHLLLGRSEIKSGGSKRPSNLSDAYEALIAAIYLDQGYKVAKDFHIKTLESIWSEPAELIREKNPKGTLQEMTQKNHGSVPKYITKEKSGPEHAPFYKVVCVLSKAELSFGEGKTLKSAQEEAARKAIKFLLEQNNE